MPETLQEFLEKNEEMWIICETCGRLARRANPSQSGGEGECKHCRSRRIHLIRLTIWKSLNREEE